MAGGSRGTESAKYQLLLRASSLTGDGYNLPHGDNPYSRAYEPARAPSTAPIRQEQHTWKWFLIPRLRSTSGWLSAGRQRRLGV